MGYSQTPQYRRSWDWQKNGGTTKTAVLGVIYNIQNPYPGLENGRRYWEGGGIGRGGVEGDDCTTTSGKFSGVLDFFKSYLNFLRDWNGSFTTSMHFAGPKSIKVLTVSPGMMQRQKRFMIIGAI